MSQMSSNPTNLFNSHPGENPFRYGWRYVPMTLPDGTTTSEMVPLTLDDVLHPQEGDVIPENTQQERDRRYLHDVLERTFADATDVLTLSDCLVDWDVEDIAPLSADMTVLEQVQTKDKQWGLYRIAEDGGRPLLTVEIVSPHTRGNDVVKKKDLYHRIGVPVYLLVDQEKEDGPRRIVSYRHTPSGYVEVKPDGQGRYRLVEDILVALEGDRLVCFDRATGAELGDYTRVSQQLEDEIVARKVAEDEAQQQTEALARAEKLAIEQTEARARAEKEASEQTMARARAEKEASEQTMARARAEKEASEQTKARIKAEKVAREQAEARTRAEKEALALAEAQTRAEEEARQQAKARSQAEEQMRLEAKARSQAEEQMRLEAKARSQAEEEIRKLKELVRQLQAQ